jgi:hypothetical protein
MPKDVFQRVLTYTAQGARWHMQHLNFGDKISAPSPCKPLGLRQMRDDPSFQQHIRARDCLTGETGCSAQHGASQTDRKKDI